jgi:hypothetical protein
MKPIDLQTNIEQKFDKLSNKNKIKLALKLKKIL